MGPIAPADECPKCETHMEEFLGDLAEIIIMPGDEMDEPRNDDFEEVKEEVRKVENTYNLETPFNPLL